MDQLREAQLLQQIYRLTQELDYTRSLLLDERKKVAELEVQAAYTPHTNVECSSNLGDYADDEQYGDAFKRAKLCRLLELSPRILSANSPTK